MFSYLDFRSYFNYYFDACGSDPFHFVEMSSPKAYHKRMIPIWRPKKQLDQVCLSQVFWSAIFCEHQPEFYMAKAHPETFTFREIDLLKQFW